MKQGLQIIHQIYCYSLLLLMFVNFESRK